MEPPSLLHQDHKSSSSAAPAPAPTRSSSLAKSWSLSFSTVTVLEPQLAPAAAPVAPVASSQASSSTPTFGPTALAFASSSGSRLTLIGIFLINTPAAVLFGTAGGSSGTGSERGLFVLLAFRKCGTGMPSIRGRRITFGLPGDELLEFLSPVSPDGTIGEAEGGGGGGGSNRRRD
ncbi:unnamed protein product [Symbiodinium sp. CCMP2592]|nr:unnamed protein product [Symbiodinium sp. CCMP2592]